MEPDNEKQSKILSLVSLSSAFKVSFMHKGDCLIYIALSKNENESVTFLKRQLEMLHSQIISLTTKNLIKTLQYNPSYDVINDIFDHHQQINNFINNMPGDPSTFLN